MRKITKTLLVSALIGCSNIAIADLSKQPTVYKSGQWEVRKSVDAMTDKVTCTGIYGKGYRYQLNNDSLFIGVKGGPRSVTLRYGTNAAERLRLASDMETKINYIILKGGEFRKLSTVNRLRLESLTYVRGIVSADIDLKGMNEALAFIKAGCKASPSVSPPQNKPPQVGSHSHGGRSHTHPLPAQGVAHQHGGGAIGK